jgi:hypothetical protein
MTMYFLILLAQRPFKQALLCLIWDKGTQVIFEKVYFIFLGKGPSQGQIPGLLGHGFKILLAIRMR